ncbi:5' nucleotidase, NT5C type [Salegentibacter chungangensis]|uniref:5'(3')-deoxyribonucleotidase n=1 Tax=Salegentibacter chungangensis TaxID=1335724 RepID=A0ABW3NVP7_9FLAO
MKKESIAIDMDGVVANVEVHFIDWYNEEYDANIIQDDLKGKSEDDAFPVPGIIKKYANTEGFFRTVPVMEGAVDAVKRLNESYEVYLVSAAMEFPRSLLEKRAWIEEHFPFIDWKHIVFCGDKSIVGTDYMIDDHTKNLDPFEGRKLLFDAFHNLEVSGYHRAGSWQEVLHFFEKES